MSYFGVRYFGKAYFGPAYWSTVVAVTVDLLAAGEFWAIRAAEFPVLLEAKALQQVDCLAATEILPSVVVDAPVSAEFTSTQNADTPVVTENVGGVAAVTIEAPLQLEFLSEVAVTADYSTPIEIKSQQYADRGIALESTADLTRDILTDAEIIVATEVVDATGQIEILIAVRQDVDTPVEVGHGSASDFALRPDTIGEISLDTVAQLELIQIGGTTAAFPVPLEFESATQAVGAGTAVPLEFVRDMTLDRAALLEIAASVTRSDALVPTEILVSNKFTDHYTYFGQAYFGNRYFGPRYWGGVTPSGFGVPIVLEFGRAFFLDIVAPSESALAMTRDMGIKIESTLAVIRDVPIAVESVTETSATSIAMPLEWTLAVRRDGVAQVEIVQSVLSDAPVIMEAPHGDAADFSTKLDVTANILRDDIVVAEWTVATIVVNSALPLETLISVVSDIAAPTEFLAGLAADVLARLDTIGQQAVSIAISNEIVAALIRDQQAIDEILRSVNHDAGLSLEVQAGTASSHIGVVLESIGDISRDIVFLDEWESEVEGVTSGTPVVLEFNLNLRRDVSVPAGGVSRLPSRIVRNVSKRIRIVYNALLRGPNDEDEA